jgi:8-oxo-dGTP pyrophosphatase MutT (NUDIX family)
VVALGADVRLYRGVAGTGRRGHVTPIELENDDNCPVNSDPHSCLEEPTRHRTRGDSRQYVLVTADGVHLPPTVVSADGRREFACFPAAILGFLVNADDEILLLSHPDREGHWEVINGAVEEGENPVEALRRETAEEAGPDVRIRPVGLVHTWLHRYDAAVPAMLSIAYVATYLGGEVVPGSDMANSEVRWAGSRELQSGDLTLLVPSQPWLFERALAVHSCFSEAQVELEPWQGGAHGG